MEIKGKVIQFLAIQTGAGKNGQWKKQEFILETPGQYPKKVAITLWGEKVDDHHMKVGDSVTISVNAESREYNGRWYTELRAWKIEGGSGKGGNSETAQTDYPQKSEEPPADFGSDELPF